MMLASLAAVLLQATPAAAPPLTSPATVDPVVVQADRATLERQRQAVESFVGSLSEPTRRGRLARWRGGVCPGVVGLPQRYGGYVVDRIAIEALAVDLAVEGPGCRPNILVL